MLLIDEIGALLDAHDAREDGGRSPARMQAHAPRPAAGATEEVIRGYALNHARHEYNMVEPDETRSYTEATTPTQDANPAEPGPPQEFGTAMPHSQD